MKPKTHLKHALDHLCSIDEIIGLEDPDRVKIGEAMEILISLQMNDCWVLDK